MDLNCSWQFDVLYYDGSLWSSVTISYILIFLLLFLYNLFIYNLWDKMLNFKKALILYFVLLSYLCALIDRIIFIYRIYFNENVNFIDRTFRIFEVYFMSSSWILGLLIYNKLGKSIVNLEIRTYKLEKRIYLFWAIFVLPIYLILYIIELYGFINTGLVSASEIVSVIETWIITILYSLLYYRYHKYLENTVLFYKKHELMKLIIYMFVYSLSITMFVSVNFPNPKQTSYYITPLFSFIAINFQFNIYIILIDAHMLSGVIKSKYDEIYKIYTNNNSKTNKK